MTHPLRLIMLTTCLLSILATNAAGQSAPTREGLRDLHFEMAVELLRDASVAIRVQSMAGNDYRPHIDILKKVATEDFLQQLKSTSGADQASALLEEKASKLAAFHQLAKNSIRAQPDATREQRREVWTLAYRALAKFIKTPHKEWILP